MHFSPLILASLVALAATAPAPNGAPDSEVKRSPEVIQLKDGTFVTISAATNDPTNDPTKRSPEVIQLKDGTFITVSDADNAEKRSLPAEHKPKILPNVAKRGPKDIQLRDGSWLHVDALSNAEMATPRGLDKRDKDHISSCGPRSGWMPLADHGFFNGEKLWGYNSTVAEYCARISYDYNGNSVVIAAGHKSSYTIRWKHESPTITSDDKRGARVGLKGDKPGHVEFEINNKRKSGDYTVKESDCNAFLLHLAEWKNKCYGVNNADTKGGTWQMESNKLTFHALPGKDSDTSYPAGAHDEFRV